MAVPKGTAGKAARGCSGQRRRPAGDRGWVMWAVRSGCRSPYPRGQSPCFFSGRREQHRAVRIGHLLSVLHLSFVPKSQLQCEAALGFLQWSWPPLAVRWWVHSMCTTGKSPWDWGEASPWLPKQAPGATPGRSELLRHSPGEAPGRRALFRVSRRWEGPGAEQAARGHKTHFRGLQRQSLLAARGMWGQERFCSGPGGPPASPHGGIDVPKGTPFVQGHPARPFSARVSSPPPLSRSSLTFGQRREGAISTCVLSFLSTTDKPLSSMTLSGFGKIHQRK